MKIDALFNSVTYTDTKCVERNPSIHHKTAEGPATHHKADPVRRVFPFPPGKKQPSYLTSHHITPPWISKQGLSDLSPTTFFHEFSDESKSIDSSQPYQCPILPILEWMEQIQYPIPMGLTIIPRQRRHCLVHSYKQHDSSIKRVTTSRRIRVDPNQLRRLNLPPHPSQSTFRSKALSRKT